MSSLVDDLIALAAEPLRRIFQWLTDNEDSIDSLRARGQETLREGLASAVRIAILILKVFVVLGFLFTSSLLIYGLLYYLIMPERVYSQEIYFDYGSTVHDRPTRESNQRSAEQEVPTALVDFLTNHRQWYNSEFVDDGSKGKSRILSYHTQYDILLHMDLPESRRNLDIGMFMVDTMLMASGDKLLAESHRPAIAPQRSIVSKWLRDTVLAFPRLLGFVEESERLTLELFNGFKEPYKQPMVSAAFTLSNPRIQVYRCTVEIIAQITGVRYYMFHWFFTTAAIFVFHIAFFEGLVLAVLYLTYLSTTSASSNEPDSESDEDDGKFESKWKEEETEEKRSEQPKSTSSRDTPSWEASTYDDTGLRQRGSQSTRGH